MNLDKLRKQGKLLHERLRAGDVTAPAEIAEIYLGLVARQLYRKYPNLDDSHLIPTAVEDALISYFNRPDQYDPNKLSLFGYLRMSANGDLLNAMKQYKAQAEKLVSIDYVEVDYSDSEQRVRVQDDFDLESFVITRSDPIWERLADLLPDPMDQEIVLLIMDRVRDTEVYGDALGISNLSRAEQMAVVKRHKDRIKKVLKRNIDPSELV